MLAILLEIDCCLFSRFERIKALEVIIWKSKSNGNFNVKFQIHLFVSIIFCLFDIFYHCRFTTMDPDLDAKKGVAGFFITASMFDKRALADNLEFATLSERRRSSELCL